MPRAVYFTAVLHKNDQKIKVLKHRNFEVMPTGTFNETRECNIKRLTLAPSQGLKLLYK